MAKAKKTVRNGANRDGRGRFQVGNPGGPGNPHAQRIAEYRDAVRGAVTKEDLKRVFAKLVKLAKAGDMAAIKELLDRTIGKATAAPVDVDAASVELPTLATTRDTVAASNAILKAVSEGRLSPDTAAKYAMLVELARRTLETHDLAQRIETLEAQEDDN